MLLSINRFERKKNIALALRAVGALSPALRKPGKVALVLAGGYDTRVVENVEVYAELEALGKELGLSELLYLMPNVSMVTKARLLQRKQQCKNVFVFRLTACFDVVMQGLRVFYTHPIMSTSASFLWRLCMPSAPSSPSTLAAP